MHFVTAVSSVRLERQILPQQMGCIAPGYKVLYHPSTAKDACACLNWGQCAGSTALNELIIPGMAYKTSNQWVSLMRAQLLLPVRQWSD